MSTRRPVETLTNATMFTIAVVMLGCAGRPLGLRTTADAAGAEPTATAERFDLGHWDGLATPRDTSAEAASRGRCAQDEDCVAVLDYRSGFECWAPSAASREDLRRDPCLIPWSPEPMCTTAAPPKDCPGGLIPVDHSCIAFGSCVANQCVDGMCRVTFDLSQTCGQTDGGAKGNDCDTLRVVYGNALRTAMQCSPAGDRCSKQMPDFCGCQVPYNPASRCADVAVAAYAAWRKAGCQYVVCAGGCVVSGSDPALCFPSPIPSYGMCDWQR